MALVQAKTPHEAWTTSPCVHLIGEEGYIWRKGTLACNTLSEERGFHRCFGGVNLGAGTAEWGCPEGHWDSAQYVDTTPTHANVYDDKGEDTGEVEDRHDFVRESSCGDIRYHIIECTCRTPDGKPSFLCEFDGKKTPIVSNFTAHMVDGGNTCPEAAERMAQDYINAPMGSYMNGRQVTYEAYVTASNTEGSESQASESQLCRGPPTSAPTRAPTRAPTTGAPTTGAPTDPPTEDSGPVKHHGRRLLAKETSHICAPSGSPDDWANRCLQWPSMSSWPSNGPPCHPASISCLQCPSMSSWQIGASMSSWPAYNKIQLHLQQLIQHAFRTIDTTRWKTKAGQTDVLGSDEQGQKTRLLIERALEVSSTWPEISPTLTMLTLCWFMNIMSRHP